MYIDSMRQDLLQEDEVMVWFRWTYDDGLVQCVDGLT